MEKSANVRMRLALNRLTQTWLAEMLREKGVAACASEISKALSGEQNTPKAKKIVEVAETILDEHEKK